MEQCWLYLCMNVKRAFRVRIVYKSTYSETLTSCKLPTLIWIQDRRRACFKTIQIVTTFSTFVKALTLFLRLLLIAVADYMTHCITCCDCKPTNMCFSIFYWLIIYSCMTIFRMYDIVLYVPITGSSFAFWFGYRLITQAQFVTYGHPWTMQIRGVP